jgi:hypothetical protein
MGAIRTRENSRRARSRHRLALGRQLFIEYAPDDVFTTNVLGYMFNERK